jgi:hypothetical protein
MKRVSALICLFLFLGLTACSQQPESEIPEWKLLYIQLLRDTMTGEMESRGVLTGYGIELYDFDEDGVPELQEHYTSASKPECYYIWYIEENKPKLLMLRKPNGEFREYSHGLFVHKSTGNHVLSFCNPNVFYSYIELYKPTEEKEIWDFMLSVGHDSGITTGIERYTLIEDGIESDISEDEFNRFNQLDDSFWDEYAQVSGEFLSLQDYSEWNEDAARVLSDYFDAYDGDLSNAAREFIPVS